MIRKKPKIATEPGAASSSTAHSVSRPRSSFDDPEAFDEFPEEPHPDVHISLVEGADVYFVEDDATFFRVGNFANRRELDKSYMKLAISMHPDKNGGSTMAKEAIQYLQTKCDRFRLVLVARSSSA